MDEALQRSHGKANAPGYVYEITITVGVRPPVVYLFGTLIGTSDYVPKASVPDQTSDSRWHCELKIMR
jgi:hypothetical protein